MRQVLAVAWAEFRFGLRRGGPIVGTAAASLLLIAGTLYLTLMNAEGLSPSDAAAAGVGAQELAMAWPVFEWLAMGLLPIVTAQAIPADRQFGVHELLRSLPLTGGVYLAGKILGTLGVVLLTGGLALALHLVLHAVLIGSPQVNLYLELALLSGLPVIVWASTIGVLTGVGFATRRAAMFAGVIAGIAGTLIWSLSAGAAAGQWIVSDANRLIYQAPSRFVFGQYNLLPPWVGEGTTSGLQAAQAILIAFLVLLGVGVVARMWLKRKEAF